MCINLIKSAGSMFRSHIEANLTQTITIYDSVEKRQKYDSFFKK